MCKRRYASGFERIIPRLLERLIEGSQVRSFEIVVAVLQTISVRSHRAPVLAWICAIRVTCAAKARQESLPGER